jgi:FkbM family methyltransferase
MGVLTNPVKAEKYFLKKLFAVPGKKVVFDVGANVGNYAEEIRQFSKDADIYSFEPHPQTFEKLNNRAASLNAKAFDYALSSSTGTIKFYDYVGSDGGSTEHASALKEVIEDIHHKQSIEYEVKSIRLDDFVKQHSIQKIDLLKIDTEGFEMEVLKGAKNLLDQKRIDLIQIEFNEMNVVSRTYLRDFMQLLPDYRFFRLMRDGLLPLDNYFAGYHEIFAFQNILAVRNSSDFKA